MAFRSCRYFVYCAVVVGGVDSFSFFLPFHLFISLLLFGNISRFNLFRLLPKEMFSAVVVVGGIFFNSLLWCDMLAAVNSHIKWFVMGRACLHSFALILQPS